MDPATAFHTRLHYLRGLYEAYRQLVSPAHRRRRRCGKQSKKLDAVTARRRRKIARISRRRNRR